MYCEQNVRTIKSVDAEHFVWFLLLLFFFCVCSLIWFLFDFLVRVCIVDRATLYTTKQKISYFDENNRFGFVRAQIQVVRVLLLFSATQHSIVMLLFDQVARTIWTKHKKISRNRTVTRQMHGWTCVSFAITHWLAHYILCFYLLLLFLLVVTQSHWNSRGPQTSPAATAAAAAAAATTSAATATESTANKKPLSLRWSTSAHVHKPGPVCSEQQGNRKQIKRINWSYNIRRYIQFCFCFAIRIDGCFIYLFCVQ